MRMRKRSPLDLWELAKECLPSDLDGVARRTGAIQRARNVSGGEDLLRLFLLYVQSGSLSNASALSSDSGLVQIKPESIFYRLRRSREFLSEILAAMISLGNQSPLGHRLILVDATCVCGPAAPQTSWRIHVAYDPHRGVPTQVSVTNRFGAEGLGRFTLKPGDLVVGDRAYGKAPGMYHALEQGADVLIRVQKYSLRLLVEGNDRLDWDDLATKVPEQGAREFEVCMPIPPAILSKTGKWSCSKATARIPVRLIGARNLDGEVVWLLTNLSSARLPKEKACQIYRVRWQVELFFKRLKSLGDLDLLPSRDGPTAEAYLLAKLILLCLTCFICDKQQAFSPYGYPIGEDQPKGQEPLEGIFLHTQEDRCSTAA